MYNIDSKYPYCPASIGFVFYIFIPGYLLLRLVKIKFSNFIETVLFSIGLSIVFLMITGLLLNSLSVINLLLQPLSVGSLAIVINIAITVMAVLSFFFNNESETLNLNNLPKIKLLLSLFVFPILSIIGVMLILFYNNYLLMISILIIIPIFIAFCVLNSRLSSKLSPHYALILFSIVLALVLSNTLMSNYMFGDDIHGEFNTFIETKNISFWDSQNYGHYQEFSDNAMLSVTILPTILSNLLNIDPNWVFKIIIPIFYSLIVIGLYCLYRPRWGEKVAFISVFFFVANYQFFTVILTNAKQMVGELFYVLLFLLFFSKEISSNVSKWVLFMFFFFALVVSHYSMSYMLIFLILLIWLIGKLFLKNLIKQINGIVVAFALSLTFFWYLFIVQGPYIKIIGVFRRTFNSFFTELFLPSSRGLEIQQAIGLAERPSLLHYAGTILYDITILFVILGFIVLVYKWRKSKFDSEFFIIIALNIALLFSAVAVPRFSGFLELGRLYHILLIFLAPLFVIGLKSFFMTILNMNITVKRFKITERRKNWLSYALILILLSAFFMFQSGLLYEVTNDPAPSSFVLSGYKMQNSSYLVHEGDVFCAVWLSTYGDTANTWTFSDRVSLDHVLNSYSNIDRRMLLLLSNTTEKAIASGTYVDQSDRFFMNLNITYVYLSQFNIKTGLASWDIKNDIYFNLDEIPALNNSDIFVNKIYSNSLSEAYYRIP